MLSLSSILHPSDFSPGSEAAFAVACALARDHGAGVVVLHVVPPPAAGETEQTSEAPWERLLRMQSSHPEVPVEHLLENGPPVKQILEVARQTGCDLIVLGTHGRGAVARHLLGLGSVAEEVVRQAPCPVLTVKVPLSGSFSAAISRQEPAAV